MSTACGEFKSMPWTTTAKAIALPSKGFVPLSAKSYVQDGLIHQWDGIENAGYGVHDAAATQWIDLIDNANYYELNEHAVWGDAYLTKESGYKGYVGKINRKCSALNNQLETVVLKRSEQGNRAAFWSLDEYKETTNYLFQGSLVASASNKWSLASTNASIPYVGIPVGKIVSISGFVPSTLYENLTQSVQTANVFVPYARGCLLGGFPSGSPTSFNNYGTDGNIYSIRAYIRELTLQEMRWNYLVDRLRFGF